MAIEPVFFFSEQGLKAGLRQTHESYAAGRDHSKSQFAVNTVGVAGPLRQNACHIHPLMFVISVAFGCAFVIGR